MEKAGCLLFFLLDLRLMNEATTHGSMLAPLGAGDLVDRAVRLYRQNFFTLLRIASLPVVVSAIGSVLVTFGWRGFYTTSAKSLFAVYLLLLLAGIGLQIVGTLLTLMAMGGAARNLVRHLLWGEAVTVRETFRSVRARFWSLLAATFIVAVLVSVIFIFCFYGGILLASLAFVGAALMAIASPILGIIVGGILSLAAILAALWLFFLLAGKFAYVPQVLLVEGQGVFASIGRSASLAGGNWRRLAALVMFSLFATYSALMIFLMPLFYYAYSNDIELFSFDADATPVWYSVTLQVVWQLSIILLAPIWMLGLSLMYVDERVRQEAYDVELMAARSLGEMPPLANPNVNPLRPALGVQKQLPIERAPTAASSFTTLNLR